MTHTTTSHSDSFFAATLNWLREDSAFFTRPATIIRSFKRENLRPDLIAGLTVAVVMLPQGMAYALIADLPPQTGLYAAIIAAIVGVLWGSSSHLHTGPTNAASLLVLSTLATIALPGSPEYVLAAGVMAVLVGIMRLVMGLARLGILVNFVADSVVIGFTAGAGILISVNQLRHLFRLDVSSSAVFTTTLRDIFANITQAHWQSTAIGLGTVLFIILLKRIAPKLPGALLGMVGTAVIVFTLNWHNQGVIVLGELPRGFPPLARLPIFNLNLIRQLITGAAAVAAIGLVEAMSIARTIAAQSGEHIDSNQEFVGQGIANIAAGFFSGYTCSGSFTRSAVNYDAGAKSPFAVIFSGIWVLIALLLFAPLASFLPRAALAGVIVMTAYGMIDRAEMKRIWRTSRGDSAIMVATMIATLLLPLEFAVITGILVSFVRYIAKTSAPGVHSMLPDDKFEHFHTHDEESPVCPQLGVLTIEGSLYFGATTHVEEAIRANMEAYPEQRYLLLRMHRVNQCDITGLHMLEAIVRLYREQHGDVFMVGVRQPVWQKMKLSGFTEALGVDHYFSQERAILNIFKILDPAVCIYKCPHRIWRECQSLPKSDRDCKIDAGDVVPVTAVIPNITPKTLWQRLSESNPPTLIDIREPSEFEQAHIPNADLIPMPKILSGETDLPTDHEIVLICRTGRRTRLTIYKLQQQGFNNLLNMDGGMVAWEAAGLPAVIK